MEVPRKALVSYRSAIIGVTAILTGIGLLAIYASSSIPAHESTGNEFAFIHKQVFVAAFGFITIFIMSHLPFAVIERSTLIALFGSIVLLCLVHVPSLEGHAKGASRWIIFQGFSIQPAEIAKLATILFLAKSLSRKKSNLARFRSGVLPNLLIYGIFCLLLLIQPDFGTAALLFSLTFLMLFVAGLPRIYLLGLIATSAIAVVSAIAVAPYRVARLLTFLDPWAEFRGSGFQIIQSYVGFQNGGLLGLGLGESRQKLFFLPEAHTDFILAVIGEELGLVGVILICCLFAYLVFLGYRVTAAQKIPYRKFLAFGITSLIASQAILNMGVTMGMLPTKGITLPFVSNGANSLLVFLLAIAILARISQEDDIAVTKHQ